MAERSTLRRASESRGSLTGSASSTISMPAMLMKQASFPFFGAPNNPPRSPVPIVGSFLLIFVVCAL